MPSVTLKKAIELSGKSKRTIQRYMSNGKLSYKTNLQGHKEIDTSELMRVFGELSPIDPLKVRPVDTLTMSPLISEQIAKAIAEAQAPLLEQISDLITKVSDLTNRLEYKPVVEPLTPTYPVNKPRKFTASKKPVTRKKREKRNGYASAMGLPNAITEVIHTQIMKLHSEGKTAEDIALEIGLTQTAVQKTINASI